MRPEHPLPRDRVRAPWRVINPKVREMESAFEGSRLKGRTFKKPFCLLVAETPEQDMAAELEALEIVAATLSDDYPALVFHYDTRVRRTRQRRPDSVPSLARPADRSDPRR